MRKKIKKLLQTTWGQICLTSKQRQCRHYYVLELPPTLKHQELWWLRAKCKWCEQELKMTVHYRED